MSEGLLGGVFPLKDVFRYDATLCMICSFRVSFIFSLVLTLHSIFIQISSVEMPSFISITLTAVSVKL